MAETAVQTREKEGAKTALALLQKMKPSIAAVLPKHMTPERMSMIAFTAMRRNPKLLDCSMESIAGSIMTAAILGLEPSGPLGHGALVPYKGECQFQPMYQGLLDLARRSGNIKDVQCRAVYKGDHYLFRFGLEPTIEHVPMEGEGADDPNRECTHVYCIIRFTNGGVQWDQMSMAEAIAHARRFSKTAEGKGFKANTPWAEHPVPMAMKTILKRTLKYCPKSPEMAAVMMMDDAADNGKKAKLQTNDDGTFDVEFEFPAEAQEREKGTVDLESLKPGTEQNRGHGNDGLDQVKGNGSAKVETLEEQRKKAATQGGTTSEATKPEASATSSTGVDPEASLTEDQQDQLESIRTQQNIQLKTFKAWILAAFDIKLTSQLRQKHFDRCRRWCEAGGQEESDAK